MSNIDLMLHRKLSSVDASGTPASKKVTYRRLLCEAFNLCLGEEAKIPLDETMLSRTDLRTIVNNAIFSFFQYHRLRPEKSKKVTMIYAQESLLFHQFFKQSTHPKARYFARGELFDPDFALLLGYRHPAARLIALLFDGKQVRLMCDLLKNRE
ncbi:hypothetical protein [Sulfurimonas sp. HSL3-7]|uniref:hypothetical protein n=1 Tax=Sulfonitrofixus jiaomeiensis TaxID=3131938 RepID=UPI0031F75F32